jgi:hypothetical protein
MIFATSTMLGDLAKIHAKTTVKIKLKKKPSEFPDGFTR